MIELKYIKVAEDELGEREIKGEKDNPRILQYFTATTLKATHDEVAWCAAFVNWCLFWGFMEGTRSARALSFLDYGVDSGPCYGSIAVIDYGGGKGHVAFLVGKHKGLYVLLGGNQSNSVCYKTVEPSAVARFRMPSSVLVTPAELPEFEKVTPGALVAADTR